MTETLIMWLAPTSFLLSFSSYYSQLYAVGLVFMVTGFFKLTGSGCG